MGAAVNRASATPGEPFTPHRYPVAQRMPPFEHQKQLARAVINDDRSGTVGRRIGHDITMEFRFQNTDARRRDQMRAILPRLIAYGRNAIARSRRRQRFSTSRGNGATVVGKPSNAARCRCGCGLAPRQHKTRGKNRRRQKRATREVYHDATCWVACFLPASPSS